MNNEILPCPFCGGDAEYWLDRHYADCHVIECMDCGATKRSEYDVYKVWNMREGVVKQPFDKELTEMLFHFKKKHDDINKSLVESGDTKFIKPFEQVSVQDIKDYILKLKGFDEDFLKL